MPEKLNTNTLIFWAIIFALLFIVKICFASEWITLSYNHVYDSYYEHGGWYKFSTPYKAFAYCCDFEDNTHVMTTSDNNVYACPLYTINMGGTCSAYAILFMYVIWDSFGGYPSLIVVSNVDPRRSLHAIVEYNSMWWDVSNHDYGTEGWFRDNRGWLRKRSYTYDKTAYLSAQYQDGVRVLVR